MKFQPKEYWKHIENLNMSEIAEFKAWLDAVTLYQHKRLKEQENEAPSPSQTSIRKAHAAPNTS